MIIFQAGAQPIYFRHYQVENGLANNTVYAIFQDDRQFMWIGTKEGLCRFDGNVFKTFNMSSDTKDNSSEFVYHITEGVHQTLWIGTRKGLYEFNPQSEKFRLINESVGYEVLNVEPDEKGNIWFTAGQNVYRYNGYTKT
ncbi:MAG: histidine kinase, partial [Mucilaginibacter sp.]|nr:histidine kinase [Mucilaginibacter sp.]